MSFDHALSEVLGHEGGYVDDPADSGGRTNWGISESVAEAYGKDPKDLTKDDARKIYRDEYWDSMCLDRVCEAGERIAEIVFNVGVNAGVGTAGMRLQTVLNAISTETSLRVDGRVGSQTIKRLNDVIERGWGKYIKQLFLGSCEFRYAELTKKRPKDKRFIKGWLNRMEALRNG